MIESAFEDRMMRLVYTFSITASETDRDQVARAIAFGRQYPYMTENGPELRMRAIMENVVANGGVFIP